MRLVLGGENLEEHLMAWCYGDAGRDITVKVCIDELDDNDSLKVRVQRVRAYLRRVRRSDGSGSALRVTLLGVGGDDDSDDD
jgi:hypothetical protein